VYKSIIDIDIDTVFFFSILLSEYSRVYYSLPVSCSCRLPPYSAEV